MRRKRHIVILVLIGGLLLADQCRAHAPRLRPQLTASARKFADGLTRTLRTQVVRLPLVRVRFACPATLTPPKHEIDSPVVRSVPDLPALQPIPPPAGLA